MPFCLRFTRSHAGPGSSKSPTQEPLQSHRHCRNKNIYKTLNVFISSLGNDGNRTNKIFNRLNL